MEYWSNGVMQKKRKTSAPNTPALQYSMILGTTDDGQLTIRDLQRANVQYPMFNAK
jgi:hypothetical protein